MQAINGKKNCSAYNYLFLCLGLRWEISSHGFSLKNSNTLTGICCDCWSSSEVAEGQSGNPQILFRNWWTITLSFSVKWPIYLQTHCDKENINLVVWQGNVPTICNIQYSHIVLGNILENIVYGWGFPCQFFQYIFHRKFGCFSWDILWLLFCSSIFWSLCSLLGTQCSRVNNINIKNILYIKAK